MSCSVWTKRSSSVLIGLVSKPIACTPLSSRRRRGVLHGRRTGDEWRVQCGPTGGDGSVSLVTGRFEDEPRSLRRDIPLGVVAAPVEPVHPGVGEGGEGS